MPLSRIDTAGSEIAAKRKDKPVIVYCDTGNRSGKAASALKGEFSSGDTVLGKDATRKLLEKHKLVA